MSGMLLPETPPGVTAVLAVDFYADSAHAGPPQSAPAEAVDGGWDADTLTVPPGRWYGLVRARKGTVATAAARKRGRRLFGRDRGGRFRTHGRNSHATVRGTRWSIEDTCKGTVTRVSEGAVAVRDFAKRKTVLVKAGKSYLARPRR